MRLVESAVLVATEDNSAPAGDESSFRPVAEIGASKGGSSLPCAWRPILLALVCVSAQLCRCNASELGASAVTVGAKGINGAPQPTPSSLNVADSGDT